MCSCVKLVTNLTWCVNREEVQEMTLEHSRLHIGSNSNNSHVIEVQLCVIFGAKDQCGTIGVSILA